MGMGSGGNLQLWIWYRSSRREGWEQCQRGGEWERLPRQLLTALLSHPRANEAEPVSAHSLFRETNICTKHTASKWAGNSSKINLCLSGRTFSRAPVKHGGVWPNYRWTSRVHGHKDISEPVSRLQPFIKHWQLSAIIITGREKTWLNKI